MGWLIRYARLGAQDGGLVGRQDRLADKTGGEQEGLRGSVEIIHCYIENIATPYCA